MNRTTVRWSTVQRSKLRRLSVLLVVCGGAAGWIVLRERAPVLGRGRSESAAGASTATAPKLDPPKTFSRAFGVGPASLNSRDPRNSGEGQTACFRLIALDALSERQVFALDVEVARAGGTWNLVQRTGTRAGTKAVVLSGDELRIGIAEYRDAFVSLDDLHLAHGNRDPVTVHLARSRQQTVNVRTRTGLPLGGVDFVLDNSRAQLGIGRSDAAGSARLPVVVGDRWSVRLDGESIAAFDVSAPPRLPSLGIDVVVDGTALMRLVAPSVSASASTATGRGPPHIDLLAEPTGQPGAFPRRTTLVANRWTLVDLEPGRHRMQLDTPGWGFAPGTGGARTIERDIARDRASVRIELFAERTPGFHLVARSARDGAVLSDVRVAALRSQDASATLAGGGPVFSGPVFSDPVFSDPVFSDHEELPDIVGEPFHPRFLDPLPSAAVLVEVVAPGHVSTIVLLPMDAIALGERPRIEVELAVDLPRPLVVADPKGRALAHSLTLLDPRSDVVVASSTGGAMALGERWRDRALDVAVEYPRAPGRMTTVRFEGVLVRERDGAWQLTLPLAQLEVHGAPPEGLALATRAGDVVWAVLVDGVAYFDQVPAGPVWVGELLAVEVAAARLAAGELPLSTASLRPVVLAPGAGVALREPVTPNEDVLAGAVIAGSVDAVGIAPAELRIYSGADWPMAAGASAKELARIPQARPAADGRFQLAFEGQRPECLVAAAPFGFGDDPDALLAFGEGPVGSPLHAVAGALELMATGKVNWVAALRVHGEGPDHWLAGGAAEPLVLRLPVGVHALRMGRSKDTMNAFDVRIDAGAIARVVLDSAGPTPVGSRR